MIGQVKQNLDAEIVMIRELSRFYERYENSGAEEKRLYSRLMNSLLKRIKIVNESLPEILNSISLIKNLDSNLLQPALAKVSLQREVEILVSDRGKEEFLRELNINEQLLKKVKKQQIKGSKKHEAVHTVSLYGKIANKIFFNF